MARRTFQTKRCCLLAFYRCSIRSGRSLAWKSRSSTPIWPGPGAPEGQRPPRLLAGPALRAIGLDVLRAGRASVVSVEGREYQLVPLRNNRSVSPTALMAMRVLGCGADAGTWRRRPTVGMSASARNSGFEEARHAPRHKEDPWVEVLRGAIEADLSSREEIDGERQQARAVRGALRFVTYLAAATTAREVAEAAIQAAAVWFDADARVYRRRPGGEYVLVASLPGANVPPEGRQLSELVLGFDAPFVRSAPVAGLAGGREGIVLPMAASGPVEWALVLLGAVPAEADVTLEALGRVLGVQMERLALLRADRDAHAIRGVPGPRTSGRGIDRARSVARARLPDLRYQRRPVDSRRPGESPHGRRGEREKLLAAAAGDTEQSMATLQVRTFPLGSTRRARLELRAGSRRAIRFGRSACG